MRNFIKVLMLSTLLVSTTYVWGQEIDWNNLTNGQRVQVSGSIYTYNLNTNKWKNRQGSTITTSRLKTLVNENKRTVHVLSPVSSTAESAPTTDPATAAAPAATTSSPTKMNGTAVVSVFGKLFNVTVKDGVILDTDGKTQLGTIDSNGNAHFTAKGANT